MDSLILITIITSISSLTISLGTLIKHSECSKCVSCDTRTPNTTPVGLTTPLIQQPK